ncbi:Hypothetical predicted protein [Cloeon dipterum]|uniref:Tetraspanin n=1 Tax=Cloeon dipterum TaxID=197152 RepID=A0A8S1DEC0_9INSE|nr:Hypothetical predicted protein [Cloeon dipterum]
MCCSSCCCCFPCTPGKIRCILIFFNILLAVAGGLLVFVGAVIQWNLSEYEQFISTISSFLSAPGYLLIIVGIALLIVAIVGFCGAVNHSHWVYILSLVIVIGLQVAGGVLAFAIQDKVDQAIMTAMKDSMVVYNSQTPQGQVAREGWKFAQESFKCCGTESQSDWDSILEFGPPDSCNCEIGSKNCDPQGIYAKGCFSRVSYWFRLIESSLGYLALSFALLQLISAIFICLCRGTCSCLKCCC